MPLTRNLYREDEVLASLKYCLLRGKAQEAIFWTQEALDSDMRDEVLESLFWVWVLGVTTANPWWLATFRETLQKGTETVTDEEVQYLVMWLCRSPQTSRDGTALALLGLGLRQDVWCQERVGLPALPTFSRTLSSREITVARAVRQRKVPLAWGLLIPAWGEDEGRVWEILKALAGSDGPEGTELVHILHMAPTWFPRLATKQWTWPIRAAALALTCWPASLRPILPFEPPIELVGYRFQWMTNPMRYRRLFAPQGLALFWFTERGQLGTAETTERELMEHLESAMRGSAFWGPKVPELSASDSSRENFYDKYFPNDIPDEWTAADRQVSHGRGVISDPANTDWDLKFETALNTWFANVPCHLWQGISGALRAIYTVTKIDPKTHRPGELLRSLAAAYDEVVEPELGECLAPVKREFMVVS